MKNLLHLGEDRYLTTLLLKHFSNYKTQFVRDAHAYTVVPDEWSVLLSQRRRWINSTIHNLAELVFLDRLCGFCCFSMRFIVFIDLFSTITQPVTVAYVSSLKILPVFATNKCLDCVSRVSGRWRRQSCAGALARLARSDLWSSSIDIHLPAQVGHDWLDDLLYPRYPCFLVLVATLFVLEDGRFLLGFHTFGRRRREQKDDCSCMSFELKRR
jgi:hypothetical protein